VNKGSGAAPDCQRPGRAPFVGRRRPPRRAPTASFALSQFGMSRLQRALRSDSRTVLNVLMACSSSTSDQAENASFACSIEHVDNFTVVLSHRMQGMAKLHDELLVLNQVCQMAKNGWHIRRGRLAASHPLLHPVLAIRRSYPR